MNRLTERVGNYIQIKGNKSLYDSQERHKAYLKNAIIRLAAYEDTGLEPEEIIDLQQKWDMHGGEEGVTAMLMSPPNPPLTLEELREMDGEPVWVEWLESPNLSCWAIRYSGFADGYYSDFFDEDYRKEWLAYRRKPEEANHGS